MMICGEGTGGKEPPQPSQSAGAPNQVARIGKR
jgi:hypothetical protein